MKYNKEFKIGTFFLLVVVVSFFLINYLKGEDLFNREIELSSRYNNVEGLVVSAPVYIKGYKAGKVSEVNYDPIAGNFEVLCSIRKEFSIPSDSRMTIYSVDIMGGKGVRIDLGGSKEIAGDGDSLSPAYEVGLIDGLAGSVAPLMEKVSEALDSISTTIGGINRMLSDENQASLANTLAHLERTMSDVRKIASAVEGRSDDLSSFIANLTILSEELNSMTGKVDTTIAEVSSVVEAFHGLVDSINDPDGTFGRLLTDDSVYDSVDSLLNDVDDLIRKIQENPKKYIKISVF